MSKKLYSNSKFNPKYVKMIQGMLKKEKASPRRRTKAEVWFLYILKCVDGTFYTGITKDLERRFKMHNDGKASRYTRSRRPVELCYQEVCVSRTAALVRECEVKTYSRPRKEKLVTKPA